MRLRWRHRNHGAEAPKMIIPVLVLLVLSLAAVWGAFLRVADRRAERRALRPERARRALVAGR